MEVSRIRALRGPNLWGRHTAIAAVVQCAPEERNIANLPGFETRLRARFPEIALIEPAEREECLTLAHALEFAALGLQAEAGCPVTFSQTTATLDEGIYQVVVEYSEEKVGKLAFDYAQQLIQSALDDTPFALAPALKALNDLDEDIRLGPSTGAIVNAAVARGIPYRRLTEGSLVQFGWGSQQRRIQAAETDASSAVAEAIAQDKELTKQLLHAAGVPVPNGRTARDAEDAWVAAQEIGAPGVPVVVKPRDGNQGKGVAVKLTQAAEIMAAFNVAEQYGSDVIVERYVHGNDFRLLVVGKTLVAAARRDPPQVLGDGVHTVQALVEQVNRDPRRGEGHATSLTKIRFDEIALATLAKQGYEATSIPPKGARVMLRNNANLSTGGTATDVTDDVHPEVAAAAIAAAQMVGLDIAGIDVVCETMLKPLQEQGGGIVEVNAAPGLRMHLSPSFGKGRAVGEAIISTMFAPGENARIPVAAVTGTNGKTTTVRLLAHMLRTSGKRVGMTNSDGVYVPGPLHLNGGYRRIDNGDCSGPRSARNVLLHPQVDAAVFETARGGILREGLGFDRCDVAVVTNIGQGDHLGLNHIHTAEEIAQVKQVIVQNVHAHGMAVLNAADPLVANMADVCPGKVTYFAMDKRHPVLAEHWARGERVVYLDKTDLIAAQGEQRQVFPLADIPLTHNGLITFQVENALAAIGAGWGLGLAWSVLHQALKTFVSDAQTAPGRFNLFQYRGATLVADYGHNPDAILALVQAIDKMPQPAGAKRSVVISGAGDRRDEDIRQQTEILGAAFDDVILYQDACQRGREDGEVLALLRAGLQGAKRTTHTQEITGEFVAIDAALARLNPGDLCLILIDQVDVALEYIGRQCQS
ncbi:cyanophycin synthetase [Parvibium lacunae]|uniref:Cyanophycin synthetase n=1 Tax=Parvibium lacunae TaxID=1888893 RepID=A0A368L6A1_9BURK|nr:cyanophycin synthetase [Parvibium lacunae]RCS59218.1 cyanophycin synthetase [Parvibium lacunae]